VAAAPADGAREAAAGVAEFEGLRVDIEAAEAALRRSEAEFRAIFEGSLVGMAQADAATARLLRVNRRFCEIVGRSEAELLRGTTFLDITHPEDRERNAAGFRAAIGTTGRYETEKRYVRKDGEVVWVAVHTALVSGAARAGAVRAAAPAAGHPARTVSAVQDITARKRAEERQALLAREVDHRAKNALAVVQAALRLTRAEDVPGYKRAVEGRVAALARAQTLLARDRWSGADLGALLRGELAAFVGDGAGPRAELAGPPVALPPGAAQPLAMALHELATNATKHGALSTPAGRVCASWRLGRGPSKGGEVLRMRWAEAGGPPVAGSSKRRGFGTRVLDATVRGQLGGTLSLDWRATGLVCEMEVPLRRVPDAAVADATAGAAG
jgi:PAS domain S-box-containing protein